jgi:hypothetical protein
VVQVGGQVELGPDRRPPMLPSLTSFMIVSQVFLEPSGYKVRWLRWVKLVLPTRCPCSVHLTIMLMSATRVCVLLPMAEGVRSSE